VDRVAAQQVASPRVSCSGRRRREPARCCACGPGRGRRARRALHGEPPLLEHSCLGRIMRGTLFTGVAESASSVHAASRRVQSGVLHPQFWGRTGRRSLFNAPPRPSCERGGVGSVAWFFRGSAERPEKTIIERARATVCNAAGPAMRCVSQESVRVPSSREDPAAWAEVGAASTSSSYVCRYWRLRHS
jgi:hypothetical protein